VIVPETEPLDVLEVAAVVDVLVAAVFVVVVAGEVVEVATVLVVTGDVVATGLDVATATGTSMTASPQDPERPLVRALLSAGSIDKPHRNLTATQRWR